MPQVLTYADGSAWSRVRHEVGPHGGRVVVPAAGSATKLWAFAGCGAFLIVSGCGAVTILPTTPIGAVSMVAGCLLVIGSLFQLVLPGNEPEAIFAYEDTPAGVRVLSAQVYLAGDPVPQRFRWERSQIDAIRIGFARGFEVGHPAMELVVMTSEREAVGLMPPRRDPQTLQTVAAILREALGLPSPRAGRAAWLGAHASPHGAAAASAATAAARRGETGGGPAPGVVPALPVLAYHTPLGAPLGPMLDRARFTPERMTLELDRGDGFDRGAVHIELTPDRLTFRWAEWDKHEWPCDAVCGVYVGFAGQHAPAELCVYAVAGTTCLFTGTPATTLRELASLLNRALGVPGSVY